MATIQAMEDPEEVPQEEQLGKQNLESLDLTLREKGLLPKRKEANIQKYSKDFVGELRRARDFQNRILHKRSDGENNFNAIQKQLSNITIGNKKIENQVKYEVMGIQNSPLKKAAYKAMQLYRTRIRKMPQESAEDLISDQINCVGKVINDLSAASDCMDTKNFNLENYYDRCLYNIIEKHDGRTDILNKLKETTDLIAKTESAAKNSKDFSKRMEYGHAQRKLRKELQSYMFDLKLDGKAMMLLKNELPLLDNLNDICEAYSGALKETKQEGVYLARHLENVMGLYFDMIRTHKVNKNLEKELQRLFTYTANMNNALRNCAGEIVDKANRSSLFSEDYQRRRITLDAVLEDIESSESRAFRELENKISGYLNP